MANERADVEVPSSLAEAANASSDRELAVLDAVEGAIRARALPLEIYRLALSRTAPLIAASFGSIYLRDAEDPFVLRPACAVNWPQSSARYLADLRIRVGRGPSGLAVAERAPVEVEDIFRDPSLGDWWDPAQELRCAAAISLPLFDGDDARGAMTFYFETPHKLEPDERALLERVASLLSHPSLTGSN